MEHTAGLSTFLTTFRVAFDEALASHLKAALTRMGAIDPVGVTLGQVVSDFSMNGGKRLRGALVALGYQAFSDRGWEDVLQAGISTELFHSFFLIHDDLMDRSDLRRGSPTVHRVFEKTLRTLGNRRAVDTGHLANSMAMLTGDLCCAMAYDALLTIPFPADRIIRALQHMQRTVDATTIGQVLDMIPHEEPTGDLVTKIQILKTARYSVEAPLHLGMILAEARQEDLDSISRYAIPVGVAFQIKDDLLGTLGSEEEIGKPATSDLEEGKETLLTAFLKANGSENQRKRFAILHGKHGITKDELDEVRLLFTESGATAYCENHACMRIAEAKRALEDTRISGASRHMLAEFADYVISRNT